MTIADQAARRIAAFLPELTGILDETRAAQAGAALLAEDIRIVLAHREELVSKLATAESSLQWLAALEAAGVDNWGGIEIAYEINQEAGEPKQHTYAVEVFHLEDNPHFGTGWTWSKVIDGDEDDFVPGLPPCADEADARAKAAAWLAKQNGSDQIDVEADEMPPPE